MGSVLLTGMGGVLGLGLQRAWAGGERALVLAGRAQPAFWTAAPFVEADLERPEELAALVRRLAPSAVLHAAAMARIDSCAREPERAWRCNVVATEELIHAAADVGAALVLISTDQVFDGRAPAYDEAAPPAPVHSYGASKQNAEKRVLDAGGCVVRLPLLLGGRAGPERMGADESVRAALRAGRPLTLFCNEWRTPIAAELLGPPLARLLDRPVPGVFHLAGRDAVNRFDLGAAAAAAAGLVPEFARLVMAARSGVAGAPARPQRLVLLAERARRELGFAPPLLAASLALSLA